MAIKFEEKHLDDNQGCFMLSLAGDEWKYYQTQSEKNLGKNTVIPGFRKGNIPAAVLKKHLDPRKIMQAAISKFIDDAYKHAITLQDRKINPIALDLMELKVENVDESEIKIVFNFPMHPKIDVKEWKKFNIKMKKTSAKEITDLLKHAKEDLLTKKSSIHLIEDEQHKLKNGDIAVIDFTGSVDGIEFDGGKAKKFSLTIGGNQFIPGFEPQLIGMKIQEEKDIVVTFPTDYPEKSLANKETVFHIYLHEIKTKKMPSFNDDFVKSLEIAEVDTIAKWEVKTKKELEEKQETQNAEENEELILSTLLEKIEVKIPEKLLLKEEKRAIEAFDTRLKEIKLTREQVSLQMGSSEENLLAKVKEDNYNRIRLSYIILAIADHEKVANDPKIYEQWSEETAKKENKSVEELRAKIPFSLEILARIRNEKTWEIIKKHYMHESKKIINE